MLLLSGSVAFSWELSFDGKPKRALRLDYMARSRRQGRTPLYPASPPLTALASPGTGRRLGRHAWSVHVWFKNQGDGRRVICLV
jgi:hypothetical protein